MPLPNGKRRGTSWSGEAADKKGFMSAGISEVVSYGDEGMPLESLGTTLRATRFRLSAAVTNALDELALVTTQTIDPERPKHGSHD